MAVYGPVIETFSQKPMFGAIQPGCGSRVNRPAIALVALLLLVAMETEIQAQSGFLANATAESADSFAIRGTADALLPPFSDSLTDPELPPAESAASPSASTGETERSNAEGGNRRVRRIGALEPTSERTNIREAPAQSGVVPPAEEDAFLPAGFRAGSWVVFSRLDQAIGYATNADFDAGGAPGGFAETTYSVLLESDWSRHSATLDGELDFRKTFGDTQWVPRAAMSGRLLLDLVDGHSVAFDGGYAFTTEATSSDSLGTNVSERPGVHDWNGSVEWARGERQLETSLRGAFSRTAYEEARLASGGVQSQRDRNNNLLALRARTAYGSDPSLKPFVSAEIGWRIHDRAVDRNGDRRDTVALDLRGGLQVDIREKLVGEIALGFLREKFVEGDLRDLSTPGLFASLDWSPQRGTQLSFTANSSFRGTTSAGESGYVVHEYGIEARRQIRHNLLLLGNAGFETEYNVTSGELDWSWEIGGGIEYALSRYLALTAEIGYERTEAHDPADSWDSTSFLLGISLRR